MTESEDGTWELMERLLDADPTLCLVGFTLANEERTIVVRPKDERED